MCFVQLSVLRNGVCSPKDSGQGWRVEGGFVRCLYRGKRAHGGGQKGKRD